MSGSLTDAYFEDDTEDGKFTILLFEDPNSPGDLKMEVRLNGSSKLTRTSGQIALRPELNENLAVRLSDALRYWYYPINQDGYY
jgi:hypothetical protein